MTLNFSANLSTMFDDEPFPIKIGMAHELGFKCIEFQNPYVFSPELVKSELENRGMICDLINSHGGPTELGCAAVPLREGEFNESLEYVKTYHAALKFKKLHIMSGEKSADHSRQEQIHTLINSLGMLVHSSDFLENINVIGLIEPICTEVKEKYFLNCFETAVEIIKKVNHERIKLLLDIFHLHKITGDVKKFLDIYYPFAGHIQVSQDPGRREPFCAGGNIDYTYVFDYLRQKGHSDYIGLEYSPSDSTKKGFEWMKQYSA